MSHWKTDDKQWMKARKESWKPIKKVLLKTDALTRDRIKPLQAYYLNGQEPDIIPAPLDDEYFFAIFRLWLHADQSEENWIRILRETKEDDFKRSLGIFVVETSEMNKYFDDFGFMGGQEPRIAKILFPDETTLNFFQSRQVILPRFEFKQRFMQWHLKTAFWLTAHAAPNRSWVEFAAKHIWDFLPHVKIEKLEFGSPVNPYPYLRKILCQCVNYVEPRGLPGEDTPQRQLAEYLRQEFSKRALPKFFAEQWEMMQTRTGRNFWINYDVIDSDDLFWTGEWDDEGDGYTTFVLHAENSMTEAIPRLLEIFARLGLTTERFDRSQVTGVDLSRHLTKPMIKRLGYGSGQNIPAYRYRIHTNDRYTDDDHARVHADLLIPLRHDSMAPCPDTPSLLWVPRPNGTFLVQESLPHELYQRMVRRIFTAETGLELQRYCDMKIMDRNENLDYESRNPFYDADYQPMVNFRMPILDRPEDDFPAWQGAPLPRLFE